MQTYQFQIVDLCDGRVFNATFKAADVDTAYSEAVDFYCYALDCMPDAIQVTLSSIRNF